jgi:hydroxymethylpyrimidine/phosphomethylpyrimidine kinase
MKVCLTIAGVDPSGGAGIIADIKTFTAFDCFATAAITSLTFQNTQGVFGFENQSAECVRQQILPIFDDFNVSGVKTGMLPTLEVIEEIARIIIEKKVEDLVVDPVVRSTSGFDLIDDKALKSLIKNLFPLAKIITPNIPEAERITGLQIKNEDDIYEAVKIMQSFGAKNVLIKGGHFHVKTQKIQRKGERGKVQAWGKSAMDFLFVEDELFVFEAPFLNTNSTHGTGCTLAAAITASLANGKSLVESVKISKEFVHQAIKTSPNLGRGNPSVNHNVKLFE